MTTANPELIVQSLIEQIVEWVDAGGEWQCAIVAHDDDDELVWTLYPDQVAHLPHLLPLGVALYPSVEYLVMSCTATMAFDTERFTERGDMEKALRRGDEDVRRCALVHVVGPWPPHLAVAVRDRDGRWERAPHPEQFGGLVADLMARSLAMRDSYGLGSPSDGLRRQWVQDCIEHEANVVVSMAELGMGYPPLN
jgi:hypothetical protein